MPSPRSSFASDSGNLDLIRAVAVLGVMFGHVYTELHGANLLLAWHFAQLGVIIFFVHTSFVLMLSLERTKLEGKRLFGAFYLRRAFRLYPLSMACVTAVMLLGLDQRFEPRAWTWLEYASNMALTTNLTYSDSMVSGLWTLPIEVQMYVVLPVLFLIGQRHATRWLVAIFALAIPVALIQPHVSGRAEMLGYVPCFLAGVLAWKLSLTSTRRLPGWLWPVGFVATWPVWFLATHAHDMPFRWAYCLGLGLTLPWFSEMPDGWFRRRAHTIAEYSYGIYLTHGAAMVLAFTMLPAPRVVQWLVFAGLAVLLPWLAYRYIERPMIGVGQRVARWVFETRDRETIPVMATAPPP